MLTNPNNSKKIKVNKMKINDMKKETNYAVLQLKMIGHISLAYSISKNDVSKLLRKLSNNSDGVSFPYNKTLNFNNFKLSKKQSAELFTEKNFGHFANKTIIVSTVSVLENYLFKIGELLEMDKKDTNLVNIFIRFIKGVKSLGFFDSSCRFIKDLCKKKKKLPISFSGLVKTFKMNGIVLKNIDGFDQSGLLAEVRHKIVHTLGVVDQKFKDSINKYDCEEANSLNDLNIGDQVEIPIDKVIISSLNKSIDFVENSSKEFISKCMRE